MTGTSLQPRARLVRVLMVMMLLSAVAAGGGGCRTSPATGQMQYNILGEQQEIALGEEAAPEFIREYGGPIPSEAVQDYVSELGHELAEVSERPDLPWEFHALDSRVINAFALPGGKVFITRGMLAEMENEAQLAAVLGHEIGHVTDRHAGQRLTRVITAQVGLGVVGAWIGGGDPGLWLDALGAGTGVFLLRYDRDEERIADALGVRYMTELGYNPVGAVQLMQMLQRVAGEHPRGFEVFQTHPHPESRIADLEELIRQEYPDYDQTGRYRFGADAYRRNVLEPLEALDEPAHERQEDDPEPAELMPS